MSALLAPLLACRPATLLECGDPPEVSAPPAAIETGGKVLVFVMDDVGVDKIGAYREHPGPASPPPTSWCRG